MNGSANTVGIIGAGTMGAGIAQVAATAGWTVELMDVDEATVRAALAGVGKRLDRLVEKQRLTRSQRDEAAGRLNVAASPQAFSACNLLLEAVVEDLEAKVRIVKANLAHLPGDAVIATNTSSLSVGRLGDGLGARGGLRFAPGLQIFRGVSLRGPGSTRRARPACGCSSR